MFVEISNQPRDYAWGMTGAISTLIGSGGACLGEGDNAIEAELWLGAHHGSPSRIGSARMGESDGAGAASDETLAELIARDPVGTLGPGFGESARLPFLMKVLAAAEPLSLQVHPNLDQARVGFEAEEAAGVPIDAPNRNYRDRFHKPELIVALSDQFHALAGFRPIDESARILNDFASVTTGERRNALVILAGRMATVSPGAEAALLADVVSQQLTGGSDALLDAVLEASAVIINADADARGSVSAETLSAARTVRDTAAHHPRDRGVVVAALMNRVELRRGEAIALGAGRIHAYLRGIGIEVMAASDNVLRGGLTPKHIDTAELMRVLDASPMLPPRLEPARLAEGVIEFAPGAPEFRLLVVTGPEASVDIDGPAIALALGGHREIIGQNGRVPLDSGDACFMTPDENCLRVTGSGDLFIATTGQRDTP